MALLSSLSTVKYTPISKDFSSNNYFFRAKKEILSAIPPLKDLQFYFYGDVNNKEEIHKRILKLGGVVVTQLLDTTAAVVSTKADVDKMLFKMKEIQSKDIQVKLHKL